VDPILARAEEILGTRIRAAEPLNPEGRRTRVLRCHLDAGTAILKQGNDARELQALRVLDGIGVAPRLLGRNAELCLVLMEDLQGERLDEKLLRNEDSGAASGLVELAGASGRVHEATAGPGPLMTIDVDRICHAWGVRPARLPALSADALTQSDVGPDNCIVTPEGVRLFDFEIAERRHPLTDAVLWHMGFPNCGASAGSIPPELLTRMDEAYGCSTDSEGWRAAYTFRLLERLDRFHQWKVLDEDWEWGRASGRQRVLALLRGCPSGASLASEFAALYARLREQWPDTPDSMPVFPALDASERR
jgi:hypothetical protein